MKGSKTRDVKTTRLQKNQMYADSRNGKKPAFRWTLTGDVNSKCRKTK